MTERVENEKKYEKNIWKTGRKYMMNVWKIRRNMKKYADNIKEYPYYMDSGTWKDSEFFPSIIDFAIRKNSELSSI